MDIQWGVAISQEVSSQILVELVVLCEDLGYDQFWYSNHKLYRDMYVGMTLAAVHCQKMGLGTFVAEPYSYHPAMIAAAMGTIDEVADGRAILLLGTGGANFKELGLERRKPLAAVRETIEICRALFTGERVTYHGELFSVNDAWLHFETRADLPIYVATRGDKMLELSGALADGVMIATYATPEGITRALGLVDRGCRRAGRRWQDLPVISRVDMCVDDDRQAARDAVRPMISMLLMGSYPDRSFVHSLGLEVPPALEAVCREQNEAFSLVSGHLVPDDFVDAFSWAGTPQEVAGMIARVVDIGIHSITYHPHLPEGGDLGRMIRRFAEEVVPQVEALVGR